MTRAISVVTDNPYFWCVPIAPDIEHVHCGVEQGRAAGAAAVKAALKGELTKGTIAIVRKEGRKYKVAFAPVPIQNAAKYTRSVPKEYIAKNGHDVTQAFLDYVRPIVGELPPCEIF